MTRANQAIFKTDLIRLPLSFSCLNLALFEFAREKTAAENTRLTQRAHVTDATQRTQKTQRKTTDTALSLRFGRTLRLLRQLRHKTTQGRPMLRALAYVRRVGQKL